MYLVWAYTHKNFDARLAETWQMMAEEAKLKW